MKRARLPFGRRARFMCTFRLFVLSGTEGLHFTWSQKTPCSALEFLLCKTCKIHSVKFYDLVTEMLEHTADDTVATGVYLYTYLCLFFIKIADFICVYFTVFQLKSFYKCIHVCTCQRLVEYKLVDFLLFV